MRGDGPRGSTRSAPRGLAGLIILCATFAASFAAGMTAASASTPVGTWLTNTAVVEYQQPVTGAATTAWSNAADTQVAAPPPDSTGPVFGARAFTPNPASNAGTTVRISVSASDTQTRVDTVVAHLAMIGLADSTLLRDDGLGADTLAGDGLWNATFLVDSFVPAETYPIVLAASDTAGNWTRAIAQLVVTDNSRSLAVIRSFGVRPVPRVAGNAVSVYVGRSDEFSRVRFEYRALSGGSWTLCETAPWSDPNPDSRGPVYGIYWNMDPLPEDTYLVRAVAWNRAGETDPSPAAVKIVKDARDSWIHEYNDLALQLRVRRHRFGTDIQDTSMMTGGTAYTMPETAQDTPTVWIRSVEYRTGGITSPPPVDGSGLVVPGVGAYRRFEREDGASAFADWVTVTIPYPDGDLGISEDRLAIYWYDTTRGAWVLEPGAVVDKVNRTVTVRVRHFTDFAVLGRIFATSLGNVLVSPVPWKPNDGNPLTGTEFTPGVANTGITFEQMPAHAVVAIFSPLGERVVERTADAAGSWQWDVRNGRGEPVASGVYIYTITTGDGQRRTGKLVIIR